MKNKLSRFAIPYVVWMALLVVVPIILVVIYAFTADTGTFTLDNFTGMGIYAVIFTRSFKLALIATAVCLLIGYPVSYMIAKEGPQFQRIASVVIMLPMWVNFLLRTYSWMSILENNGLLNQLFRAVGLIDLYNNIAIHFAADPASYIPIDHFQMMGSSGAVVLGMVYNYLPFMILPIYSVIVKLDPSLLEAARDLGANSMGVFRRVIFPLSLPGILSGVILAIGRIVGESAALLFTAGSAKLLPKGFLGLFDKIFQSGGTLTIQLYLSATSEGDFDTAFGIALVLLVIVFVINIITKRLTKYFDATKRK